MLLLRGGLVQDVLKFVLIEPRHELITAHDLDPRDEAHFAVFLNFPNFCYAAQSSVERMRIALCADVANHLNGWPLSHFHGCHHLPSFVACGVACAGQRSFTFISSESLV